jgi:hypothetical protein
MHLDDALLEAGIFGDHCGYVERARARLLALIGEPDKLVQSVTHARWSLRYRLHARRGTLGEYLDAFLPR